MRVGQFIIHGNIARIYEFHAYEWCWLCDMERGHAHWHLCFYLTYEDMNGNFYLCFQERMLYPRTYYGLRAKSHLSEVRHRFALSRNEQPSTETRSFNGGHIHIPPMGATSDDISCLWSIERSNVGSPVLPQIDLDVSLFHSSMVVDDSPFAYEQLKLF